MVQISITYDSSKIDAEYLKTRVIPPLRASVGAHVHVSTDAVEVEVSAFSDLDISQYELKIVVILNYVHEILMDAAERRRLIVEDLRAVLKTSIRAHIMVCKFVGSCQDFSGNIDDCAQVKRFIATLEHGNDLSSGSEAWLRNHVTVCEAGCREAWNAVQAMYTSPEVRVPVAQ